MAFDEFKDAIKAIAGANGYEAPWLAAQAWQESRFNPDAYNARSGARGIVQFIPSTWEWAKTMGWIPADADPSDPFQNLTAAVRYMNWLARLFPGAASPRELALASYNWGQGNVLKLIKAQQRTDWDYLKAFMPAETQGYVEAIKGRVDLYRQAYGIAVGSAGIFIAGFLGLLILRRIL